MIVGAHGVRGAVRLKSFTAEPAAIAAYGPLTDEAGTRSFRLALAGMSRGAPVARIEGVETGAAAEALAGVRLYVPRAALPAAGEEEYYHADLIGLEATLAGGGALGRVSAVHNFGAGDVIEIAAEGGASLLVPFSRAAVPVVDLAGGRLVVDAEAAGLAAETGEREEGR